MLTDDQKLVRKEFRKYLRTAENVKGFVLDMTVGAVEEHLPRFIQKVHSSEISCIYDEGLTLPQLLSIASHLRSDSGLMTEDYAFMSLKGLEYYIKFYAYKLGVDLSDIEPEPEEEISTQDVEYDPLVEGSEYEVKGARYERNQKAKKLCIEKYGCKCFVCGADFKKLYGEIGEGFIEVHHLIPISQRGGSYKVDPVNDLRPLCSNCHSMIHKKNPPFSIDELKAMYEQAKQNQ